MTTMATITYKTLTKKIKNKKCKDYGKTMELKVLFPAVKQYEFIPDVWDNIMSYRKKPIEAKLWKMGINPLQRLLKDYTRRGFTNMNCSSIPLEERKTLLIKNLMDYHLNKGNIVLEEKKKEEVKMVYSKYANEGEIIKVGDMINYNLTSGYAWCYDMCGGVVVKIGKSRVTIQLYNKKMIKEDWKAKMNQSYGYDIYSWEDKEPYSLPDECWRKPVKSIVSVSPESLTLVDNYLIEVQFDHGR